jgi:pyruvate/2-oxoglutarate dehydrogenase complex dihydrolipoamide acyltransferase (E2) component
MGLSIDWGRLEEVVKKAVKRARAEGLKEMAEAIKTLAEFMRTGFEKCLRELIELRKD